MITKARITTKDGKVNSDRYVASLIERNEALKARAAAAEARAERYRGRALALRLRTQAQRIGNRAALRVAFRLREDDRARAEALEEQAKLAAQAFCDIWEAVDGVRYQIHAPEEAEDALQAIYIALATYREATDIATDVATWDAATKENDK